MSPYKHILIASDLSSESVELCRKAKVMADLLSAELSIAHVVEPPPLLYGGGEFVIPMDLEVEQSLATDAQDSLNKLSALINAPKNEQWVVIGNKREEILKMVKERGIDLIIMGGHDRHGLAALFSSTTDTVVHAMPCDVLVIRLHE